MILGTMQQPEKNELVFIFNHLEPLTIILSFNLVLPGGGVSVAERARLFGNQVSNAQPSRNWKPPTQKNPPNNPPKKPSITFQERNYEPLQPNIERYSTQDTPKYFFIDKK